MVLHIGDRSKGDIAPLGGSPSEGARTRVFEFAGPPGAGKSTIVDALRAQVGSRPGITFGDLSNRELIYPWRGCGIEWTLATARAIACHAAQLAALIGYGLRERGISFDGLNRARQVTHLADSIDRLKRRRSGADVVIDQGMLHAVASLAIPGKENSPPRPCIALPDLLAQRVDGVIWLELPHGAALERLVARTTRFSRFDQHDRPNHLLDYHRFVSALRMGLDDAERAGVPILTLDAVRSPETNAAVVCAWLEAQAM